MEPNFLTEEQVRQLHLNAIRQYGGSEGLRDSGMLQSALAMPQTGFGGQYLHEGLFEMAAAYLYHLVQNHPFVDGNKRVGLSAAIVFLDANGVDVMADEDATADMVLAVAQGQLGKEGIGEFLRRNSVTSETKTYSLRIY